MKTIAFTRAAVRLVAGAALVVAPTVFAGDPPAQYAASCGACHAVGVAGAPATGNEAAWAPRMAEGDGRAGRVGPQGLGCDAAGRALQ